MIFDGMSDAGLQKLYAKLWGLTRGLSQALHMMGDPAKRVAD